jgi:glycosyltransferase involved in cell wall biosynthesis
VKSRASNAPDLLWVTNLPTPYRAPLWAALGARRDLVVAFLAESEPNRHWKVTLDRDRFRIASLRARPIGRTSDSVLYAPSLRLLRLLSRRPAALVIDGWESPAYLVALWWARRCRVPVIASYRSTLATHRFSTGPVATVRRWFFRRVDVVLTAGPASTAAVVSMGVPRERVVEGFNTVDVGRFAEGAAAARARLPRRPGHHVVYVGQLVARKNVGALLEAFAQVRGPHDTLAVVGTGPLESRLRAQAAGLGIGDAVAFHGHLQQDALIEAYAAADTMVLPSTEEVWGLVVNEGLAAGLHAVVSTACGITPSIAGMPGVFPAEPTVAGLAAGLRASRASWSGPIRDHPVCRHTPEALSAAVMAAVGRISGDRSIVLPDEGRRAADEVRGS